MPSIDERLHKTEYGFRKNKSTTHAVTIIRRLIDLGERTTKGMTATGKRKTEGEIIQLIPLDWEKAFDKVDQEDIFNAMERTDIDPKLIRPTRQLYKHLAFYVEHEGY